MDQLSDEQTQVIRKMSTERIQGRLMRTGVDEEVVYGLGRPELIEELAKTMLDKNVTAAEGSVKQLTELEVRLMELEERKREHEFERARLNHKRMVYEQNMAFQRELIESQREQRAAENAAREQRQKYVGQT